MKLWSSSHVLLQFQENKICIDSDNMAQDCV
uniref:Uncharacterized protein n=1 Tax=Rhizophora mucronata TaxID=61149 RepID=A0A2P2QFA5_RHIMU